MGFNGFFYGLVIWNARFGEAPRLLDSPEPLFSLQQVSFTGTLAAAPWCTGALGYTKPLLVRPESVRCTGALGDTEHLLVRPGSVHSRPTRATFTDHSVYPGCLPAGVDLTRGCEETVRSPGVL